MTVDEKLIRNKIGLLDLAAYLKNVSEACRVQPAHVLSREEGLRGWRSRGIEGEEPAGAEYQESGV